MTDPMIDPLPPDIVALLEREKLAYPAEASLKVEVLARVEKTLGAGVGPGGGGSGDGGGAGGHGAGGAVGALVRSFSARAVTAIAVGSFIAGGVVGGVVVNQATTAPSSAPVAPANVAMSVRAIETAALDAESEAESEALMDASPAISAAPVADAALARPATKDPADQRGDLTRERELLDVARASLSRGSPNDAIAAAERHSRRWPQGYLTEERDAVWIQALVAAGRRADAERKAAEFRRGAPNSVLMPAVDRALNVSDEKGSLP
ncbi:hypothetical protein BH11MYX4_BH11MYX4_22900 [soil metagenome]